MAASVILLGGPLPAATVSWTGGSGDWNVAANWSTGALPGPGDDVVISPANTSITITHSSGTHTVMSLMSQVAFELTGGSLTVSNTVQVNNVFLLAGGTLLQATVLQGTNGGSFAVNGSGTLDGVTVNGVLDVGSTYSGATLTVVEGLVLNGTALLGNATGNRAGALIFAGSQTLSGNGTVVFGGNSSYNALRLANGGTTLTIGEGITVHGQTGYIGYDDWWGGGVVNVAVINQGTISADVSGGTIYIVAEPFANQGLAQGANGGTLSLMGAWTNAGTLNVAANSTLTFGGSWTNAGTIDVTNATVNLGGTFTLADLGAFDCGGGVVNLTGTLDNTNTVLSLNALGGAFLLSGGTVLGGTVTGTNGVALVVNGSGTLEGVTVNGVLDVGSTYSGATLTVVERLVLNGTALLGNATGNRAGALIFAGSQTLSGNGTVVFGGNSSYNALRLANGGTTLTIGEGITVHGQTGYIGYDDWWGGGVVNVAVINQGTISADVSGGTITVTGQSLTNLGNLWASAGATVNWGGDVLLNGSQILSSQAGGTIRVGGNLLGDTRNASQYSPEGTLAFGSGAHQMEAMSQDLGNVANGYVNNFAYGMIALDSGAQVTLVDQYTNSAGQSPECVYANSLVVPSGATLNLNGLHLYARLTQIGGAVTGGSVSQVPSNGGAVTLGTGVSGSLSPAGALDEWTFFGRAGENVTVVLGMSGASILPPYLGYADVRLIDPSTNLVAEASNTVARQTVALTNVRLPADGTYRVDVRAPANQPSSTGDYQLTIWDVTPNVYALVLNQQANGRVNTPYSVDEWNFSAAAGQSVQFNLVNASASGVAFDLTGPDNWGAFTNLTASSGLVTLPYSGAYAVTAHGMGGAYNIAYAFDLAQTAQTNLALGTAFSGQFVGSGQAQLFVITVTNSGPLRIVLSNNGAKNAAALYAKVGSPPTLSDFNFSSATPNTANQQILVPSAFPGAYYILVYGSLISTPGSYTLEAGAESMFLTSVTPSRSASSANFTITLAGAGFLSSAGMAVDLVSTNGVQFAASSAEVDSLTQITASFLPDTVPAGTYSVLISQASGVSAELTNAFTVAPAGTGVLQTKLVLPAALGRHTPATLYIDYANTGLAAMPAPLIQLSSGDTNIQPIMTLNAQIFSSGFWTSVMPEGFSTSVAILASGAQPGVLNPGEHVQVPVYWAGILQPWDFSLTAWPVGLTVVEATDTRPMNWAGMTYAFIPDGRPAPDNTGLIISVAQPWENGDPTRADELVQEIAAGLDQKAGLFPVYNEPGVLQLQSPGVSSNAWSAIVSNLQQKVGSTLGDWVQSLDQQAVYLSRQGETVNDIGSLWSFEVLQAAGLGPLPILESAMDAWVPTPGLGLSLSRSFLNTIPGRYHFGMFGYGWASGWDMRLRVNSDGSVSIDPGTGSPVVYDPDTRTPGAYLSAPGDQSTLVGLATGEFELEGPSGMMTRFAASGQIEYVHDPNNNQVAPAYNAAGQLVSLTHSSGRFLDLAYNAGGTLASVTDSCGRITQYAYDAAGQHLVQVALPDGRLAAYTYSVGNGSATDNGLTSISFPDSTHAYFAYDNQGRLIACSRDNSCERLAFGYDYAGSVSITNADSSVNKEFFDQRDLLIKFQDSLGNITTATYDNAFNLRSVTDPAGLPTTYSYDAAGNPTTLIDALGHTTVLSYAGPFNRLTSATDANGGVTTYVNDDFGNLRSIIYPDDSIEGWTYDMAGNPLAWTNRRGQTIRYQLASTGQPALKVLPDGRTTRYAYDAHYYVTNVSDSIVGETTFGYDAHGFLTNVTYPNGQSFTFSYDACGRRSSRIGPDTNTLYYSYDSAGRFASLSNGTLSPLIQYVYDDDGRLVAATNGNGTLTTFQYDQLGQVLALTNYTSGGDVLSFFDYLYDSRGNRISMASQSGVRTYAYDSLSRLVGVAYPNGHSTSYSYDSVGNRTLIIDNGLNLDYEPNVINEYTVVGGALFGYDADANLIGVTASQGITTYEYDPENRLVAVLTPTDGNWQYVYDALGNRVAEVLNGTTNRYYLIDPVGPAEPACEYGQDGGLVARYDFARRLVARTDSGDQAAFYLFDGLGNTANLTGNGGSVLNSYDYDAFGSSLTSIETVENQFRFGGALGVEEDDTELLHMQNRYYSSTTGRFVSPDPIGLFAGDMNTFCYVGNNPVNATDASGLGEEYGQSYDPFATFVTPDSPQQLFINNYGPYVGGRRCGSGVVDTLKMYGVNVARAELAKDLGPNLVRAGYFPVSDTADQFMDVIIYQPRGARGPGHAEFIGQGTISSDFIQNSHGSTWGRYGTFQRYRLFAPLVSPPPIPDLPPLNPQTVTNVTSFDPNDLIGPMGYARQNYVVDSGVFAYEILFQNQTNATAPAQTVSISDPLSSNLDWTTFQLSDIAFGGQFIPIPPNTQQFQTNVAASFEGVSFQVQVAAGIQLANGEVFADFASIDPATGLPPPVNVGFLPPEDGTGRGSGHVSYTIRPKPDLPNGTQIANVAYVQFDQNPVIATDQVNDDDPSEGIDTNKMAIVTINDVAPTSAVSPLPTAETTTNFVVAWSGSDLGSGIASYDIFVSTNSGPWNLWLAATANTSAQFSGAVGNTYSFYSVATDNVGNREADHATADATTTVIGPNATVVLGGNVWYYPTNYPASQPSSDGVGGVSVTLSGGLTTNEISGSDGSYSFSGLSVGQDYEVSVAKSDDTPVANGVTTLDIALIRRQILGLAPLDSPYKLLAADVNASGTVDTLDIALIRRLVLGLTNTFPVGLWRFVPADYVFPDPSNPWDAPTNRWYTNLVAGMTGQDYVAIKLGDVNNSWVSPVPTPQVRLGDGGETKTEIGKAESRNLAPQVRLGNGTGAGATAEPDISAVRFEAGGQVVQTGEKVAVPVSVSGFHHATTAQFTLGWDPSVLRYAGVGEFRLRGLGEDNFGTAFAESGKLAVSWDDPAGTGLNVADSAALFTVYFDAIGAAGSVSPVAFGDSPTAREASVGLVPRAFASGDGQVIVMGERLVISCGGDAAKGTFCISVPSLRDRRYILEAADSLSGANWRAVGAVDGDGSVKALRDPNATTQQRFYRVRVE